MYNERWRARRAGVLACGVLLFAATAAADPSPTNYELVHQAALQASMKLTTAMPALDGQEPLVLRSVQKHSGDFLVENALSSALTESGRSVRARADSMSGPVLEFEVVDLGLAYTRVHRRAWLGDKRVGREARARLFARVVDQDEGKILWSGQAEAKVRDEVRHADLAALEEKSDAGYLKATLPPERWNKIVEPAVVTGIVVGLIVLFFSNQDTK